VSSDESLKAFSISLKAQRIALQTVIASHAVRASATTARSQPSPGRRGVAAPTSRVRSACGRPPPSLDRDGPREERLRLLGVEAARDLDDVRAFVEVDRDQVREH
jgi:hypothetical protein